MFEVNVGDKIQLTTTKFYKGVREEITYEAAVTFADDRRCEYKTEKILKAVNPAPINPLEVGHSGGFALNDMAFRILQVKKVA